MRLENVQNWPKNVEYQANWPKNIQKVGKLLQNSYLNSSKFLFELFNWSIWSLQLKYLSWGWTKQFKQKFWKTFLGGTSILTPQSLVSQKMSTPALSMTFCSTMSVISPLILVGVIIDTWVHKKQGLRRTRKLRQCTNWNVNHIALTTLH